MKLNKKNSRIFAKQLAVSVLINNAPSFDEMYEDELQSGTLSEKQIQLLHDAYHEFIDKLYDRTAKSGGEFNRFYADIEDFLQL